MKDSGTMRWKKFVEVVMVELLRGKNPNHKANLCCSDIPAIPFLVIVLFQEVVA